MIIEYAISNVPFSEVKRKVVLNKVELLYPEDKILLTLTKRHFDSGGNILNNVYFKDENIEILVGSDDYIDTDTGELHEDFNVHYYYPDGDNGEPDFSKPLISNLPESFVKHFVVIHSLQAGSLKELIKKLLEQWIPVLDGKGLFNQR